MLDATPTPTPSEVQSEVCRWTSWADEPGDVSTEQMSGQTGDRAHWAGCTGVLDSFLLHGLQLPGDDAPGR